MSFPLLSGLVSAKIVRGANETKQTQLFFRWIVGYKMLSRFAVLTWVFPIVFGHFMFSHWRDQYPTYFLLLLSSGSSSSSNCSLHRYVLQKMQQNTCFLMWSHLAAYYDVIFWKLLLLFTDKTVYNELL